MNDGTVTEVGNCGVWQVATETSLYLLDLDKQLVTRVPDAGAGAPKGLALPGVSQLRRDHQPIPLAAPVQARLGQPMLLMLNLRGDGEVTARRTTIVRRIRRLR